MSKKKNKGKGIFFLFFILAALGGVFVSGFPLIEKMFPDTAEKVNNFRGYYTGPMFITPESNAPDYFSEEYHGLKSTMKEEQVYYFIPAADINFVFSAYYDDYSNALLELYLYKASNMNSVVATNINVPYETGRQVGAISQKGEEIPEHANWFNSKCKEGVLYALKVIPKSSHKIGTDFIIKIDVADGWISLPGLWGVFIGIMFILLITYFILRFIWNVRHRNL